MRDRWIGAALGLALLLSGCSLARPEAETADGGDMFVGFYVVYEPPGTHTSIYDSPYLTTYGTEALDAGGYGTFSVEREVLMGVPDEDGLGYTFPGLEGLGLFYTIEEDEDGPYVSVGGGGMSRTYSAVQVTDEGTSYELEGTIYVSPPEGTPSYGEDSYTLRAFRVYQREDGAVYLDGSGNAYAGGGFSSFKETAEETLTVGGETTSERVSVEVHVVEVPEVTRLVVHQFDADNVLLRSDDLALRKDLPEVRCLPEAAWVMVEEWSGEEAVRTAYAAPGAGEAPAVHSVVILDELGIGHEAELVLKGA